jgi:cyclase
MANAFGKESVVLAIDAAQIGTAVTSGKNEAAKPAWHAFSNGGKTDTGIDAVEWAVQAVELGAGEILLTSIDADGTGAGYDLELTRAIVNAVSVPVIASGGAGTLEQIADVLLAGADAALAASILHFGKTTVPEIKKYLELKGVCVKW